MSTLHSTDPTGGLPTALASTLCGGYRAPLGVHDEMFSGPGVLRPQWQRFAADLNALGPVELSRRWEAAKRLIYENGVTYNLYADPAGRDRPWELDPVPLLLDKPEWSTLSAALAQRARLLNHILVDLHGPQRLLHEGLIPPEFVFAHSAFLRPCHNLHVPQNCYLHVYAAHLARDASGHWRVLADRAQVPSGAGYALENRIVISRMLPQIYHSCQVKRLAPFFMTLRDTLRSLAAHHRENPRIVLLSPGPQPDLFRRCLSGPVPGLHAGRRRRSGGARQPRVSEDSGRAAAGRRDLAPGVRRGLRPARTPRRLAAGRAGPGAGGPQRQCGHRQCAGQRPGRGSGLAGDPARPVPAAAGRRIADSVGAHLVVRPQRGAAVRAGASGQPGDQAGVSAARDQAAVRPRPVGGRAVRVGRTHPPSPAQLRGPGTNRALGHAGLERRGARTLAGGLSRVPGGHRRRLCGHARRPVPRFGGRRVEDRLDGRRRRQQGRVDPVRWPGGAGQPAQSFGADRGPAAKRQRAAQPRGRQLVLAGPQRRAGRGQVAFAPQHSGPADERIGDRGPARDRRAVPGAGRTRPAGSGRAGPASAVAAPGVGGRAVRQPVRHAAARQPALESQRDVPGGVDGAGPHFDRQLADSVPHRAGFPPPQSGPRAGATRRPVGPAQPGPDQSVGVQRAGHGEHDPDPRLALFGHGAPHRADAAYLPRCCGARWSCRPTARRR